MPGIVHPCDCQNQALPMITRDRFEHRSYQAVSVPVSMHITPFSVGLSASIRAAGSDPSHWPSSIHPSYTRAYFCKTRTATPNSLLCSFIPHADSKICLWASHFTRTWCDLAQLSIVLICAGSAVSHTCPLNWFYSTGSKILKCQKS